MSYFQGFLIPVPTDKKDAYIKVAEESGPFFAKFGAQRTIEGWGDDVPQGETTDMFRAVKAEDGENTVFSWIEWESKAACDKAHDDMTQDEYMENPPEMPFDGMRMIYSGFDVLGESGARGQTGYVQGYIAPVQADKRQAYADMCQAMREVAIDCGAQHAVDGWSEDIQDGQVTDFKRAVQATEGEAIAFGFVEWPSKQAFEQGSAKMHEHQNMPAPGSDMPVDGKRLIFGGFDVIYQTG